MISKHRVRVSNYNEFVALINTCADDSVWSEPIQIIEVVSATEEESTRITQWFTSAPFERSGLSSLSTITVNVSRHTDRS